jgi:putative addiction module killer protein
MARSKNTARGKPPPAERDAGVAKDYLPILSRCMDAREREFYLTLARKFGWSKQVLAHRIDDKTYEKACASVTDRLQSGLYVVKTTAAFDAWLTEIRDGMTRRRLVRRLRKAENGNMGDVQPVGQGVSEMREHFGAGWRMYYVQRGATLIVMLGGGDKSTQQTDISAAITLAGTLED